MKTPTPETDAAITGKYAVPQIVNGCHTFAEYDHVSADFARKLERERDEARDMLKISTSGEVCQDCGVNMSPSLIESGSCIFCIQRQTAKERDEARLLNAQLEYCKKALLGRITIEEEKSIIAERDQLRKERDELKLKLAYLEADNQEHIKRDMQRTGEVGQLRKVADELALCQQVWMNAFPDESWEEDDAALASYNELPHVKKS